MCVGSKVSEEKSYKLSAQIPTLKEKGKPKAKGYYYITIFYHYYGTVHYPWSLEAVVQWGGCVSVTSHGTQQQGPFSIQV